MRKLSKNDILMCFSSGSKNHLGKVALIHEDMKYYAGGFMGILRCYENAFSVFIYTFKLYDA